MPLFEWREFHNLNHKPVMNGRSHFVLDVETLKVDEGDIQLER